MTRASFWRALAPILLMSLVVIAGSLFLPDGDTTRRWTFLGEGLPNDLVVRAGPWAVEPHAEATGARALVSREGAAPAVLLVSRVELRDLSAKTRCMNDCGIVFRYRNDANHEIVRLEAEPRRVVLASVRDGREELLAVVPVEASAAGWHELRVDASGGLLHVGVDGRLVVSTSEGLVSNRGSIGLWAPAGVAYFDELSIVPLTDSPRALEVLPILARPRG